MTETTPEGIVNPPIDQLLEHVDSKYRLVLFAAKRARQINAYYSQLAEGLLENVGPLVETTNQEKPLSIAMREIQAGVVEAHETQGTVVAVHPHPDFEHDEGAIAHGGDQGGDVRLGQEDVRGTDRAKP